MRDRVGKVASENGTITYDRKLRPRHFESLAILTACLVSRHDAYGNRRGVHRQVSSIGAAHGAGSGLGIIRVRPDRRSGSRAIETRSIRPACHTRHFCLAGYGDFFVSCQRAVLVGRVESSQQCSFLASADSSAAVRSLWHYLPRANLDFHPATGRGGQLIAARSAAA
jgi:hypothetical protein